MEKRSCVCVHACVCLHVCIHAEMGTIKDRKGVDLIEVEEIKKRWQEYTEELYKKGLHDPENHDGVITHLVITDTDSPSDQTPWNVKSNGP